MKTCKRILIHVSAILLSASLSFAQGMPSWVQNASGSNYWPGGFSGSSSDGPTAARSYALGTYNGQTYFATVVRDDIWNASVQMNRPLVSFKIFSSDPQSGVNALPAISIPLEDLSSPNDLSNVKVEAGGARVAFIYGVKDMTTLKWQAKGYIYDLSTQSITQVINRNSNINISSDFPHYQYWASINQSGSRAVFVEKPVSGATTIFVSDPALTNLGQYTAPTSGYVGFAFGSNNPLFRLSRSGNTLMYVGGGGSSTLVTIDINNLIATGSFATSHKFINGLPGSSKAEVSSNGQVIALGYSTTEAGVSKPSFAVFKNTATALTLIYYKSVDPAPFAAGGINSIKISPDGRKIALASSMATNAGENYDKARLDIINSRDGALMLRKDFSIPTQINEMKFSAKGKFALGILNPTPDPTLPTLFGFQIGVDYATQLFATIPHPTLVKNVKSMDLSPSGNHFAVGYSSWNGGTFTNVSGFGIGVMP